MIAFQTAPPIQRVSTCRQRSIRRHARHYSLQQAVRYAVDVCFRFSGRAAQVKALWSETERVWLGNKTFVDWSMCDREYRYPLVRGDGHRQTQDVEQLRESVLAELNAYWADRLTVLPLKERPHWLPLP